MPGLAEQRCSPQAAARALNSPPLLCPWQLAQVVTEADREARARDAEGRALRAATKRLVQEAVLLRKAIAGKRFMRGIAALPPTQAVVTPLARPSRRRILGPVQCRTLAGVPSRS